MNDLGNLATRRFTAALAVLGLEHAVVSPGSRNSPLALAFAADARIDDHIVIDERSAGFVALGTAKASRRPVALASTSGTAAANYLPAIAEARSAGIPLIVLTADRPPELRGAGAPQTIDQVKLYGDAVKQFFDAGLPGGRAADLAPSLALRVWDEATRSPMGPVHVNLAFREPLIAGPFGEPPQIAPIEHRPGSVLLDDRDLDSLASALGAKQAIVVAGGDLGPGFDRAWHGFAARTGIPLLADIQCRRPSAVTVVSPDLLAGAGVLDALRPEVVLRIGPLPTSKLVWTWLEQSNVPQVYLDHMWRDPLGTATRAFRADPGPTVASLSDRVEPAPEAWSAIWQAVGTAVDARIEEALTAEAQPTEPAIARRLYHAAPTNSVLFTGSSMPIRDLDTFSGPPRSDIEVLANRGANGIDGALSTAIGAAVGSGRPIVAHVGDLTVLHDVAALGLLERWRSPVVVVAVNNDGGGIFHFLPQADPEVVPTAEFERTLAAPHGHDLSAVAAGFGLTARQTDDLDEVEEHLRSTGDGPLLLEIVTDRRENVKVHERLREIAAAAAAEALRA